MARVSKRFGKILEGKEDLRRLHLVRDAVALVKKNATAKFDETVELAVNLGVDVRHSDQQVRGRAVLPSGTGKTVRVAVFARGDKADEAKAAGADIVGAEDLAEQIKAGNTNFDRCIAAPDMMGIVGQLGRILGPRNLMPNPRLGTVTPDVGTAVRTARGGEVTFRAEKAGIIHCMVGKASFDEDSLVKNVRTVLEAIQAAKPSGAKGAYVLGVALSSTMGPGVRVSLEDIA